MLIEERAKELVKIYIAKANLLYNKDWSVPEISWNIRGSRLAGFAHRYKWAIGLNKSFASQDYFWEHTIGHEIAHLIVFSIYPYAKQAHGPEWKRVMVVLGLKPDRCHSMIIDERIKYSCPICKKEFNVTKLIDKRIKSGKIRWCLTCKSIHKFNPIYSIQGCSSVG